MWVSSSAHASTALSSMLHGFLARGLSGGGQRQHSRVARVPERTKQASCAQAPLIRRDSGDSGFPIDRHTACFALKNDKDAPKSACAICTVPIDLQNLHPLHA